MHRWEEVCHTFGSASHPCISAGKMNWRRYVSLTRRSTSDCCQTNIFTVRLLSSSIWVSQLVGLLKLCMKYWHVYARAFHCIFLYLAHGIHTSNPLRHTVRLHIHYAYTYVCFQMPTKLRNGSQTFTIATTGHWWHLNFLFVFCFTLLPRMDAVQIFWKCRILRRCFRWFFRSLSLPPPPKPSSVQIDHLP